MNLEKVKTFLQVLAVAQYDYPGRVVEDLGQLDADTDRCRIGFSQQYPSATSWAVNQDSTMDVTCLDGTVHLFLEGESGFIELVPGAEVVIGKGVKYRWSPLTEKVVLLVMSTPHWTPDQHHEIFGDGVWQ